MRQSVSMLDLLLNDYRFEPLDWIPSHDPGQMVAHITTSKFTFIIYLSSSNEILRTLSQSK